VDWRYDYQLDVMTRAEHWLLNEDMRQKCELFRIALQKIEAQVGREEVEAFLKRGSPQLYDLVKWVKDKSGDFHQDELQARLIDHFANNPNIKKEDRNYFIKQSLDITNHPDNIRAIFENFSEEANAYIDKVNYNRYSQYFKILHSEELNDPQFIKNTIAQATEDIGIERSPAKRSRKILFLAENNPSQFNKCYQEMDLTQDQKEACELVERVAAILPPIRELSNSKYDQATIAALLGELADSDPKAFNFCQFNAKILGLDEKIMNLVKIPDSAQYYNKERVFKCRLILAYNLNQDPKYLAEVAKTLNREDSKVTKKCIPELPEKILNAYVRALKVNRNMNTQKHSKKGSSEIGS